MMKRMSEDRASAATVTECTAALLWEACRRDPDPASVRRALAGGADLARSVRVASEQRVSALLWRALGAADARAELGPEEPALGGEADALRMEALLLLPRAIALAVRPLTHAGLEPVVFKGPAVATRYPEPGLRPMDDIDLLLPRADHARAVEALGHAGWRVTRAGGGDHYDTVLTHDEVPSLVLEVHFGLEAGAEKVTELDPEALWSRRRPLELAGTAAFGLPPADELVVLAAHAGKPHHRFVRLVWMADLAMIVGHDPTIDWDRVNAVARQARCVTVVGTALEMARRAGVDAPVGLFTLPTRGERGNTMRHLLSLTWPLTQRQLSAYRFNYALTDSRTRRAKMRVGHVVLGHGLRARARRVVGLPPRAPSRAGAR
jgi:hypothetical protein